MILIIQRVLDAVCTVDDEPTGAIDQGLVVYAGVLKTDTSDHAVRAASKLAKLRIFPDDPDPAVAKMNYSLSQLAAEAQDARTGILLIPNFTLSANPASKGNRPSFTDAAQPAVAEPLFNRLASEVRANGVTCDIGRFGADMRIRATAWGPVTLRLNTDDIPAIKNG